LFKRLLAATAWLILVTILLCIPGSTLPKDPFLAAIQADKWVHMALFGILCFLFDRIMIKQGLSFKAQTRSFLLISMAGIAYGVLMEFVQKYWVVNRSFEIGDTVADALGCILAYFAARWGLHGNGQKKIGPDGNRDRNQN
jgi:hypothetical protein